MDRASRIFRILLGFSVLWSLFAAAAAKILIVEVPATKADAIVVLSGSRQYSERIGMAASLYRAGVAPVVLLTNDGIRAGWDESEKRNPFFFELAKRDLLENGVPDSAIVVLNSPAEGTFGEAELITNAAHKMSLNSLVLVTSPYHSRRALWTFNRIDSRGESHIGLAIAPAVSGHQSARWWCWWISAVGWQTVPSEYLKFAYYWLKY